MKTLNPKKYDFHKINHKVIYKVNYIMIYKVTNNNKKFSEILRNHPSFDIPKIILF